MSLPAIGWKILAIIAVAFGSIYRIPDLVAHYGWWAVVANVAGTAAVFVIMCWIKVAPDKEETGDGHQAD